MDTPLNQPTARQISLAITHYNRFDMVVESFAQVIDDSRIAEIVISDDCSKDGSLEKLKKFFLPWKKVHVRSNRVNMDCYRNKREAVLHCSLDWVLLLDSDNILSKDYLDKLYNIPQWDSSVFYCPVMAAPHFDYTKFAGLEVSKRNVSKYLRTPMFECALNTANYFFHREGYLKVWDGNINPHTSDTIYQTKNWLGYGGKLFFVPGMGYKHRVHPGSHYKQNKHKTGDFHRKVLGMLLAMS